MRIKVDERERNSFSQQAVVPSSSHISNKEQKEEWQSNDNPKERSHSIPVSLHFILGKRASIGYYVMYEGRRLLYYALPDMLVSNW
jgi:hypothetical protein